MCTVSDAPASDILEKMSNAPDLGKALRAWRQQNRLSQSDVATALKMTRGGYANYESGVAVPPYRMDQLRALGFIWDDVRDPVGAPSLPVTYPAHRMRYAGDLPAGDWADPLEAETFVDVDASLYKSNRFCCNVIGSSCYPALQPEDFTVWESNRNPGFGKIVIASRTEDGAATIKQLAWDPAEGVPYLKAINPAHENASASGWEVIAMLVAVVWEERDGGAIQFVRSDGIRPEQLIRIRSDA